MSIRWQEAFVFLGYLSALAAISWASLRATKERSDYWIAGGRLGWLRGGATLAATHASAGTFIGTVGVIYTVGWSFTWLVLSIPVAYWFSAAVLTPRFAQQRELTAPAFLERRYESRPLRRLGATVVLIATVVYVQAQIVAGGLIAEVVFGTPPIVGMVTFTMVMILYTLLGGMIAVVLTDLLQLGVMCVGVAIAVPVTLDLFAFSSSTTTAASTSISPLEGLLQAVEAARPDALSWGALPTALLFSMALAFTLGSIATPEKLVRYYSMRDQPTIRRGIFFGMVVATALNLGVFVLALAAIALFPELSTGDLAMPMLARLVLPPILGSLLLAAISAAMMSTVDSLLLVAGSAVSEDLLGTASTHPTRTLFASRCGVVAVGIAPLILLLAGVGRGELVQFIVLLFSALMGACFFMPVVIGVYWSRANKYGAASSMLGGLTATFAWKIWGHSSLDPVVPGLAVSAVLLIGVSLVTPGTRHQQAYDLYQTNADRAPVS